MGSKPPFGYVKSSENKHQLVVDPPAAEIVKRLFREFAGGESGRNIAAKLNAEGVDTPAVYYFGQTGKRATRGDNCQQWGSTTIMQLLRNQAYIGHMVQGKRKVSSFKTKKRQDIDPEDWVIVENTHEPIIDDNTWDSRGYQVIHPNCKHGFTAVSADAYTQAELAKMSHRSMQPFEDTRSSAERRAYAKKQEYNRKLRADEVQYDRVRAILPDDAPKNFGAFRNMKRANSERYQDLMRDYRYVLREINPPRTATAPDTT